MVNLRGLPSVIRGHTEPRVFTKPLRELTPETSYGFAVIRFAANILKQPLTPWQEWLVIHAGELLEDGRPRFRQVLVLIARQNGKTFLMQVLALYWLFIECFKMILGMSVNLQLAKETMLASVEMIEHIPHLYRDKHRVLEGNNDVHFSTKLGSMYKTTAATRKAARGKRVDRLMVDELREQTDMEAYKAGMFTMNARPYGQAWFFSNQGDDRSVVLNMLYAMAISWIENEEGDERLGMFEWSAPEGMDVMDQLGWCMANPSLNLGGEHISTDVIRGEALKAVKLGGVVEAGFRTEVMCQRVKSMDGAIDPVAWGKCEDDQPLPKQNPIALCLDMSLDLRHATLVAAEVLSDGRIRIEVLKAWEGQATTLLMRKELPEWVLKVNPRVTGWLPGGPMATFGAEMKNRKGQRPWLGRHSPVEITGEVTDACMAFSDLVSQNEIAHNGDPLLTAHVLGASKLHQGDRWRLKRGELDPCDAAYAAAGAVQLVRTIPAPMKPLLVAVGKSS